MDFFTGVIHLLFKDLSPIHQVYFRALTCASVMLCFSGSVSVGLLGSNGDILSWMLFMASEIGKIVTSGTDILSCLFWVGVLFLDFCCFLWSIGGCGGFVLPARESS